MSKYRNRGFVGSTKLLLQLLGVEGLVPKVLVINGHGGGLMVLHNLMVSKHGNVHTEVKPCQRNHINTLGVAYACDEVGRVIRERIIGSPL